MGKENVLENMSKNVHLEIISSMGKEKLLGKYNLSWRSKNIHGEIILPMGKGNSCENVTNCGEERTSMGK